MRIESVRIENFRSFREETFYFDDYTCLVGANGCGKSTVLCALNIFFRDSENSATDIVNLSIEDFHQRKIDRPIKITVTFVDLSAEAQEDFKDYFRQGKLVISSVAKFDAVMNRAEVEQRGLRTGIDEFRPFFEAIKSGAAVSGLRIIFAELIKKWPAIGPSSIRTKDAMTAALRKFEADSSNLSLCTQIESSESFYGFSRGSNRLEKYVQWVFIPAMKDVTTEQNEGKSTALGRILARTVRQKLKFDDVISELQKKTEEEYHKILDANQGALADLEKTLTEKLALWAHPAASVQLAWQNESRRSVEIESPSARTTAGEGMFKGDLARFGHGFQRSYLLALLQTLATSSASEQMPRLILACEEPELYQHPPQARHLASVLEQLSEQDAQVLICTHSPAMVTGKGFESVRLIRFNHSTGSSSVSQLKFTDLADRLAVMAGKKPTKPQGIAAKLHQELQPSINEMFFSKNLVLVEGLEDIALITSWMVLTGRWIKCRQKGVHIVQVGGKSHLPNALAIAQGLKIPVFTIFDADGNCLEKHIQEHKADNEVILSLLGRDSSNPFPVDTIWGTDCAIWPKNIGETLKLEVPSDKLVNFENKANSTHGNPGGLKKNSLQIGTKLQLMFDDAHRPPSLEKLCDAILDYAR